MWGAIAGAVVRIGTGIAAAAISKKANKQQRALGERQYRERVRDANETRYTDFLKTDTGQALLTAAKENYSNALRQNNGMLNKAGATEEQKLARNQASSRGYADSLGKLAQAAGQYRTAALGQYHNLMENARRNYDKTEGRWFESRRQAAANLKKEGENIASSLEGSNMFSGLGGGGGNKIDTSTNTSSFAGGNTGAPWEDIQSQKNAIFDFGSVIS